MISRPNGQGSLTGCSYAADHFQGSQSALSAMVFPSYASTIAYCVLRGRSYLSLSIIPQSGPLL